MLISKELHSELNSLLEKVDFKSLDSDNKFRVIATNESVDRDGDILTLDGWNIENYLKNPVILANHTYTIENIIGKATNIYQENGNIIVEGVFSKTSELGKLANSLYNEGMLKTVSVGFIGKERDSEKITNKELLELSFVAVPANPSAVSLDGKTFEKGVQAGLITKQQDMEMKDVMLELAEIKTLLKQLTDDKVESEEIDAEAKELQAKKEATQAANKHLNEALKNMKLI